MLWLLAHYFASQQKKSRLEKDAEQARQIALVFEQHTLSSLHYGDSYLKSIRKEYTRNYNLGSIRQLMQEIPLNMSVASHVTIINRDGTPIFISGYEITPGKSAKDRDYFIQQKNSVDDKLIISLPHKGRNTGKLTIRMVRRFNDANGEFGGVIFVAIDAEKIVSFFNAMKLGPKSSATLVGTDKKIRARSSYGRLGPGQDISGSRIWKELDQSPIGLYKQTSVVDNITRYYAYRLLKDYPLVVAIGVSTDDVSSAVSAVSNRDYIITLLASILVIILTFLLVREAKGSKALRTAINKAEEEIKSRKETEKKLIIREKELVRSNEELEKFAYIASHDLQEPLRKVQSFGDLLQSECEDALGKAGLDYLSRMREAASRMSGLINDVLAFSRINNTSNDHEVVNLNEVVTGALNDLELMLEENSATLDCAELPYIEADETQMRQLFQNLISNAIKYRHKERTPHIKIDYQIIPSEGESYVFLELSIADNGIGFDSKYSERIFEIFQRLHGRSDYKGTGVGLALVRKIAECHGGTARAISKPNKGATFIITLKTKKDSLEL
jgi:signal transduction histidine kinase